MLRSKLNRFALAASLVTATVIGFVPNIADAAVYSNGSKSSTFDVTLTIVADCTISANALNFGASQGLITTNITASSTLAVTCTNTTPYNVGLNAGTGVGSTTAVRTMSGTGLIPASYNIIYSRQRVAQTGGILRAPILKVG